MEVCALCFCRDALSTLQAIQQKYASNPHLKLGGKKSKKEVVVTGIKARVSRYSAWPSPDALFCATTGQPRSQVQSRGGRFCQVWLKAAA